MCICSSWARTPADALPISEHHPQCEQFRLEDFSRITMDGASFVCRPGEVDDYMRDEPGPLSVELVRMTADQYEHLPEFRGF